MTNGRWGLFWFFSLGVYYLYRKYGVYKGIYMNKRFYFVLLACAYMTIVHADIDEDDYIKQPGVVRKIDQAKHPVNYAAGRTNEACTHNLSERELSEIASTKVYTDQTKFEPKVHVINYNPQIVKSELELDGRALGQNLAKGMMRELSNSPMVDGEELGKGLASGMISALSDPEIKDKLDEVIGKDSSLYSSFQDLSRDYKEIINNFIDTTLHRNYDMLLIESLVASGAFFALWYGMPMMMNMLERQLTRPKLIIESSKKSMWEQFAEMAGVPVQARKPAEMVFSPQVKKYLDTILKVTPSIHTKIKQGKTNVKYRNLMLYGPPGTGKTMFAKELAKQSGLEYVFMSGSSFSKFKDGEGIEALDELFAWANNSTGLLIFIDEAETFLSARENMDPQSRSYQLLNNFLNYTGERSNKFMIVFATNHKDLLDSAMYRRIDDLIEMPLPAKSQRIDALNLYIKKILMDTKQNGLAFVNSVAKCLHLKKIETIAEKTKGLSYGDLEGIINTIKTDTDILISALINDDVVDVVVDRAVKKHHAFTGGRYLGVIED